MTMYVYPHQLVKEGLELKKNYQELDKHHWRIPDRGTKVLWVRILSVQKQKKVQISDHSVSPLQLE